MNCKAAISGKIKTHQITCPYPFLDPQQRRGLLPLHNVCSVSPGVDPSDWLYTGNGSHRIDVSGDPWHDEIAVTQEELYDPQWKDTPLPPDLRPYIADIRRHVMEGHPEEADKLIDKAQREAGLDKYMNLDSQIVYPMGSLHLHKAFWLTADTEKAEGIRHCLRWTDVHSSKITAR